MKKKMVAILMAFTLALVLAPSVALATDGSNIAAGASAGLDGQAAPKKYGTFEYKIKKDKTVEITAYTGNAKTVTIPSKIAGKKVTSVGKGVLTFSKQTKVVRVPATITKIRGYVDSGDGVNYSLAGVAGIVVSPSNPKYSSKDGVLFNKKKTKLLIYPQRKASKSYTIPSSVKAVGDCAFFFADLQQVRIPSSVKAIGKYAFEGSDLTSVTVPKTVKALGPGVFAACKSIEKIDLQAPVKVLPSGFAAYSGVKSVKLPSSLLKITDGITFGETGTEADFYEWRKGAFFRCENLARVKLPSGLKKIGRATFADCERLKVAIPSSVTRIGENALAGVKKVSGLGRFKAVAKTGSSSVKYSSAYVAK